MAEYEQGPQQDFKAVWSISTTSSPSYSVSKINKPVPIAGYSSKPWKIEPKSIFDYDPLEDDKESTSLSFLRDENTKYVWEGYGKRECYKGDKKPRMQTQESKEDLFAGASVDPEEPDFVDGTIVPVTNGPNGPRPFVYSPRPFTPVLPVHDVFRPDFTDFNKKPKPFSKPQ